MRKSRELKDDARYHGTARANRKEMILDSKGSKELFLEVLRRAKAKYTLRIGNFCVMGSNSSKGSDSITDILECVMLHGPLMIF